MVYYDIDFDNFMCDHCGVKSARYGNYFGSVYKKFCGDLCEYLENTISKKIKINPILKIKNQSYKTRA
jgi:hypothetical protein